MSEIGDIKKLTRREKKKQKFLEETSVIPEPIETDDLQQFALSQATTNTNIQQDNAIDIKIEGFDLSASGKELFRNASLKITNGRKYGLVGPNGHGKTTLLKHIVQRKLQIPVNIDCLLCEQDVVADDTTAIDVVLKSDVKMMSIQSKVEQLKLEAEGNATFSREAMDKLNEGYEELNAMGSNAQESKARRILSGLGFTDKMMTKATKDFSGGWRMRVSLARALFMEPTLLLLDEPTNHLDLNAVIWLDNYLQRWKKTILIVSHDQSFLDNVCSDIIHLNNKKLKYYTGNYTKFREMFAQDLVKDRKEYDQQTKVLKAMKSQGKSKKAAEKKVLETVSKKQTKSKKNKQEEDLDETGPIDLLEKPKEYQVKFDFPSPDKLSGSILGLSGVNFQYPGTKNPIFEKIDFGVDMNSRISIVGPNGVGKSTFLKLLTGEIEPTTGERTINHRVKLGKYNQHSGDQLNMNETPVEYLRRLFNLNYQEARQNLGRFGLESHAHEIKNASLSGGQRARVAFAELALAKPDVLILDEPTNNLDLESIEALCLAIDKYKGGVVVVTHDERLIRQTNCSLWVVENRNIAEVDGEFDDYRKEVLESLNEEVSNPSAVAAAAGVMD